MSTIRVDNFGPSAGGTTYFDRYLKNKYIWATDGSSNMRCIESEMPEGFYRGRTVERRTQCQQ